ncbi:Hypothetical predicted protein, partial [Podarcis lilfordi]
SHTINGNARMRLFPDSSPNGCHFVSSAPKRLDGYFYGNFGEGNEKMPQGKKKGEKMLKEQQGRKRTQRDTDSSSQHYQQRE